MLSRAEVAFIHYRSGVSPVSVATAVCCFWPDQYPKP